MKRMRAGGDDTKLKIEDKKDDIKNLVRTAQIARQMKILGMACVLRAGVQRAGVRATTALQRSGTLPASQQRQRNRPFCACVLAGV